MSKIFQKISLILFNILVVFLGFALFFSYLCTDVEIENLLSTYVFGTGKTETISSGKEPVYFKTWYQSINDLMQGSGEYAAAAEAEGAVLLKNDNVGSNPALPLNTTTDKVSLFGVTAYNPMYSLDGAGEIIVNNDIKQSFKTEFEKVGLTVNNDLANRYTSEPNYSNFKRGFTSSNGVNVNINGTNWNDISTSAKTASGYNTAIYVIGRMTNEAIDLPPVANSSGTAGLTDGDYLKLTAKERDLLSSLKAEKDRGTFDRIIVLVNAANPIQDDFIDNEAYGIDAAMWIGFPGSHGIEAVAQLLVGTATPSGRLSSMWYANRMANPTSTNFGNYNNGNSYVLYQEGMYLGYKYAETRYEDYILGTEGAGDYNYEDNVNYPFGYGLSYATFTQEFLSLEKDLNPDKNYDYANKLKPASERRKDGDDYVAKVKVTNTSSSYSGKEVVQIYAQQPYTAENKAHKVEKPAVELVGFAKTEKLAPGASQEVTVKIDANKLLASYDITENKYILDVGTYYLTAAQNSNDAVNNIITAKGKSNDNMTTTGSASLVKTIEIDSAISSAYEYWTLGGATVTNLFDNADPNKVDPSATPVTFMSRDNWSNTVFSSHQAVANSTARNAERKLDGGGDFSNSKTNYPYYSDDYPTYDKVLDDKLVLSDMIGVEYDENRGATADDIKKWKDFLDQLSWDETIKLVATGRRCTAAIDSIAKPYTNDVNASNGISWKFDMGLNDGNANRNTGFSARYDDANRNYYPVGYPCEGIIAATFNVDIAYVVGQSIGEDALWSGASGLYGFGLNLQRNPYHGRVGEYYSDDSYLTGVIAGWSSKGAQSKGLYVYNKHFVLNDQETGRSSYATWITEQALRQVHLRPFEIAIEIGDSMNVMTAFNRIGSCWVGNSYNLMTKCLRGELGMRGFAVTDWYKSTGMNMTNGLLAGNDLPDGYATGEFTGKDPTTGGYGNLAQAMRVSAQRILYTVANSNAMNFFGEGTMIISHDPAWFKVRDNAVLAIIIISAVEFACVIGTTVWVEVEKYLRRKNGSNNNSSNGQPPKNPSNGFTVINIK